MSELKLAVTILGIIALALAVLLLGDYVGYKMGRKWLASVAGIILLVSVVAFAIFAGIVLI